MKDIISARPSGWSNGKMLPATLSRITRMGEPGFAFAG
jgi:hypothetical protein